MVGRPVLTTPPGSEPILLPLVKQVLRVDTGDSSQDDYLCLLIASSRETAEQWTNRGYVTQSYREYYDGFPGHHFPLALIDGFDGDPAALAQAWPGNEGRHRFHHHYFELSRSPLQVLKQIQYLDLTGAVQTLDPSQYVVNDKQDPAQITRAPEILGGLPWPRALREVNSVWIDYNVGYGGNLVVTTTAASAELATDYTFLPSDVGRAISIPGAGPKGGALKTTIASVTSGDATVAEAATAAVEGVGAFIGNKFPNGDTLAMLMLINHAYENRLPVVAGIAEEIAYAVKFQLDKNRVYYQP